MPPKPIKSDRLRTNIQVLKPRFIGDDDELDEVNDMLKQIELSKISTALNEFDNDYTTLLKMAVKSKIPSTYLVQDPDTHDMISIFQYYEDAKPTAEFLEDIYDNYNQIFFWIPSISWVFIFMNQVSDQLSDDEELLEEINKFLINEDLIAFRNVDDMHQKFHLWGVEYNRAIITDYQKVSTIVESQEFLKNELEPLQTSSIIISNERYEYKVTTGGKNPIEMFRDSNVSVYIPWIITTYDPYAPLSVRPVIAHSDTILVRTLNDVPQTAWALYPAKDDILMNHMYFVLWVEKESPEVFPGTKESYVLIDIDLQRLLLTVDIPISKGLDQKMITSRIKSALKVTLESPTQKKINAEFNIYQLHIYEYSFADMVLSDDLFNTFLAMDETSTSLSKKKRFMIQFKPSQQDVESDEHSTVVKSSVKASLTQFFTVEGQRIELDGQAPRTDFPANTPYIQVSIAQAKDPESVELFRKIISRLGYYYIASYKDIEKQYNKFVSTDISPLEVRSMMRYTAAESQKTRIKLLKEQAPNLILSDYAGQCQGSNQPMIIQHNQKDEYDRLGKRVMEFPKENPEYLFVCPTEEAPFPTVIENKKLANKEQYPYIPCCSKNDPAENPKQLYNKIYVQNKTFQQAKETETSSKHTLLTTRIMGYQRHGTLPEIITDLLQVDPDEKVVRVGMVNSKSSLIHCLLYATKNKKYLDLDSDEHKEIFVTAYRRKLNVMPELMVQELWDMSPKRRLEQLTNPDVYLDPCLFYRALEELFNVTIWVFSGEGDAMTLKQPRFRYFNARYNTPRDCVIIYEHERDMKLNYSQCELIVRFLPTDKQNLTTLHSDEINEKLYNTYFLIYKTYTYQKNTATNELTHSINTHSTFDFIATLTDRASHQLLDSYGKLRGIVLTDPVMTILTTPLPPLNLQEWTEPYENLPKNAKISAVTKLMGRDPDKILKDELVYTVSNDHIVIRFLTQKTTSDESLDIPFSIQRIGKVQSLVDTLDERKSVVGYLLQAINTLFIVKSIPLSYKNIDNFLSKYFIVNPDVKYDVSHITDPAIPNLKTVDDFFIWWKNICPSMVKKHKLVIPSEKFRSALKDHLTHFVKIYSGDDVVIPKVLVNVNLQASKTSDQDVLLTSKTMPVFLLEKETRHNDVITKLSEKFQTSSYYYYTKDDIMYMIVNISDKEKALAIGHFWITDKRIPQLSEYGEDDSTGLDFDEIPYKTYTISPSGSLIISDDFSKEADNDQVVDIIKYSKESRFGVLLKL